MPSRTAAQGTNAVLLISCPDQPGLVARTAQFVAERGGSILHADHHRDPTTGLFLMRLEWPLSGFAIPRGQIGADFEPLGNAIGGNWQLFFSDITPRLAIFATRQEHCLADLILRVRSGDIRAELPIVISNHPNLANLVEGLGVEFMYIPTPRHDRAEAESQQLALLREHRIDVVVLAKYMQILSPEFIAEFPETLNIHHSFLPAFPGASPYQRAYDRGVKLIGATAHYVTAELDEGPIIEQEVLRVSHRDTVDDLVRKGKDVERVALARAVRAHVEHRVIVHGNRTSVFD